MKWQGRRGSANIEDRRRSGGVRRVGGIGGAGAIAVLLIGYFLGVDVTPLLEGGTVSTGGTTELTERDRATGDFVSVTLADTEEVWAQIFAQQLGRDYTPATLVLFKEATGSACGTASGATGPFYCPNDQKIYLDTAFFTTLANDLGAGGDFAAAYVVAHEVAHHVQNELGILGKVNEVRARSSAEESNALSVRIELQADCYAGVWAHHANQARQVLESGDIDEAMNAASRIGDDALQRKSQGQVIPDSFTHGTSAQRQRWFDTGLKTGSVQACDTFKAQTL